MNRKLATGMIPVLQLLDEFYTNGKTLVPDKLYDQWREQTAAVLPNHPYFRKIAAPIKTKGRKEIKLPIIMGSLTKKRPIEAINWLQGLPKGAEVVAMPKLDGVAIATEYNADKKYQRAFTRGEDGITGFDVSDNVKHIHGVQPQYSSRTIFNPWTGQKPPKIKRVFVLGEVVIHKSLFAKKYFGKILEKGGKPYKNARNFCIGMINRLSLRKQHIAALNDMTFITYAIIFIDTKDRVVQLHLAGALNALACFGFITVLGLRRHDTVARCQDGLYGFWYPQPKTMTLDRLNFMLKDWRSKFDLLQDGIVLSVCDADREKIYGTKNNRPQWAYAVKPEVIDQTALIGTVDHVVMDISKARIYYPVWVLKSPLNFDGVDVRRITAHNANELLLSKAGPGAQIKIVRSGDVIPRYLETIKSAPLELPKRCTYCNTKLKWTINKQKEQTHLFCPNDKCHGPQLRILRHFFKVLKVEGMAQGVIEAMVDAGLDTVPKILSASPQQLKQVAGFGERKTINIVKGLRAVVKDITLPELMHASSLFSDEMIGVGLRRLTPMVQKLGRANVLVHKINADQMRATLLDIPGIGAGVADRFIEGLILFREFYRSVMNIVTISKDRNGKLLGKVFCFTNFRDNKLEKLIEVNGGTISTGMSSKVNVLFAVRGQDSKKVTYAAERGIKTVWQNDAASYVNNQLGN